VRVTRGPDGLVRIGLKKAFSDGTVAVDLDPLSLLSRLCASVPPPRFHTVRRRLELLGSHTLASVGLWRIWNPPEGFVPPLGDDPRGIRAVYEEPALMIAAFTGSVALGTDGSGQSYFADHAPKRSDVFIYGPGVGELKFLADSLTSFAQLNDVVERWTVLAAALGWDDDDLEEGALDEKAPDFVALRQLAGALRGKVHLPGMDHSDMESEFDELVHHLAGAKFTRRTDSVVPALYARAYWILALLSRDSFLGEQAVVIDRTRERVDPFVDRAASRIYWLWHDFMFDHTDALASAIDGGSRDRSSLVKRTSALMSDLIGDVRLAPELERFRKLRAKVRTELSRA
jgi:hypothetical protein